MEHEEARSRQRALSLADLIRSGQSKNEAAAPTAAAAAAAVTARRGRGERASMAHRGGGGGKGGSGKTFPTPSWRTKRWGSGRNKGDDPAGKGALAGGDNSSTVSPRAVESTGSMEIPVGFGKRVSSRRAASMIDPRDAEKSALLNELERRHVRSKAVAPDYDKLSLVEKHLRREREFQEQREKRRAAAERQAVTKVRTRAVAGTAVDLCMVVYSLISR